MDIREAMFLIAGLQVALRDSGVPAGNFGPNGDGVDGRYGDVTQASVMALGRSQNVEGLQGLYPTMAFVTLIGGAKEDVIALQEAIDTWNQWRAANLNDPNYEAMANQYLCEATGICARGTTPPATTPPGPEGQPPPTTTLAPYEKKVPAWMWIVGGLLVLTSLSAVGYVIYRHYKSKPKRKHSTALVRTEPAFGAKAPKRFSAGSEITDVEMGGKDDGYGS